MEFHISRQSRDRYQFDQTLFSFNGNVIFANFHAVRLFVQKMNDRLDLTHFPERAIKAGQINALGLIDEILHNVIAQYRRQINPQVMDQALEFLATQIPPRDLDRILLQFTAEFPPVAVYQGQITAEQYLLGQTDGRSNRSSTVEELIMLYVTNKNPACAAYAELFDDARLKSETVYLKAIEQIRAFFDTQPSFGPDNQNLVEMLLTPALKNPYSLTAQLEFIRTYWSEMLGRYLYRLLSSLDMVKEEEKMAFSGPGPTVIPVYDSAHMAGMMGMGMGVGGAEVEAFSPDRDWMPNLILLAKNTYVWLDQLAQKYQRPISRLDQIPNEELDILAGWGFTGLWLIGLWERSTASAHIKQLCGNPEAISSAYSLARYQIAQDLGGESAYQNLRERAWQRGIRLASDMVPNHMAIDSDWVMDHPDWFVSTDYSPFPSYTFNGPDLAPDGRASIRIEDHYFNRTDAAVVFKMDDHRNNQTRYIYHGNDGTSMPWNDTAQLNYLKPEVREAIIQTILDVAHRFPIIRFDAAMTLAKRHYQRLWYPEPGSGGDIPSRAGLGLTKEQFDQIMPIEFWREVVDRVAKEAPDTLLLAEAFWLMEGYFVRTLGMHRVYNSAFMNMLRNEENSKYRILIKNTLEFDPEILKRYVSFMNNPDERTAVEQFGKEDKYFCICTLLSTLPGLPMFGHGQVEGFSEKYGMEFRRAYWNEQVDQHLVQRHEREIFPLLHKRYLFAGVDQFLLYDFFTGSSQVNEDVYAFSNGHGEERALVVAHNKFAETRGWIRVSASITTKTSTGDRVVQQKSLAEGLNLHRAENAFVIFTDQLSGLEYIRPINEIVDQGMYLELGAYKTHVFLNFRVVQDDTNGSYRQICQMLNGRGVTSINEALKELFLQPIQIPFHQIANPGYFEYLYTSRLQPNQPVLPVNLLSEAVDKMAPLLLGIESLIGQTDRKTDLLLGMKSSLVTALALENLELRFPLPGSRTYPEVLKVLSAGFKENPNRWHVLLAWIFTHNLGELVLPESYESQTLSWLDEWMLNRVFVETFQGLGADDATAWREVGTLRMLIEQQNWFKNLGNANTHTILEHWLASTDVQRFLGINRYQGILWFNREAFHEFVWWMLVVAVLEAGSSPTRTAPELIERLLNLYEITQELNKACDKSDYQVDQLLAALKPSSPISTPPTESAI